MEAKRAPESNTIEYKRELSNSFLKTVSAFANFGNGIIEFGVNDDRSLSSIDNPLQFAEALTNKINDNIKPVPEYKVSINDMDGTVILAVRKGLQTPYLYNNKAYQRRNASTIEVGNLTMQDLILQGRNLTFDELTSLEQNLTFEQLEKAMKEHLSLEKAGSDALISLGLLNRGQYNRAGFLLSDQNSYPGIEIAVFGKSLNEIRRRKTIENSSLIAQYDLALEIYRETYHKEVISGSLRNLQEEIPETAFREALVNALIHRNWAVQGPILIHMFQDRIEIRSPGGLPEGVSAQAYLEDMLSVPRNPRLAYVFLRLNLIERLGTGIRRIKEAYAGMEKKPVFHVTDSLIAITLPVKNTRPQLTSEQLSLYDAMNPNILYSRKELEVITGYGRTKLMKLVNELIDLKLIHLSGKGRSSRYSK